MVRGIYYQYHGNHMNSPKKIWAAEQHGSLFIYSIILIITVNSIYSIYSFIFLMEIGQLQVHNSLPLQTQTQAYLHYLLTTNSFRLGSSLIFCNSTSYGS